MLRQYSWRKNNSSEWTNVRFHFSKKEEISQRRPYRGTTTGRWTTPGPTQKGCIYHNSTHPYIHPCIDNNRISLNNAYRLLFWPWLMYFSAGDAVALFRWTVMLLKALSQRIDRGRIGWQTGGGHARERASRPSSVLWRATRFSSIHCRPNLVQLAVKGHILKADDKYGLQTGYMCYMEEKQTENRCTVQTSNAATKRLRATEGNIRLTTYKKSSNKSI